MKRLILFASYDIQGIVSNALVRYIRALSRIGDIVYFADCEMQEKELDKLIPYTLNRGAQRHKEYDFGSYKRAWEWAEAHLVISSYDCVYLLNDSVYWTGLSLEWLFQTIEALDKDAYGVTYNPNRRGPHLQSWFIGLRPSVFAQPWFSEFLHGVQHQETKWMVCVLYESGLTQLVAQKGLRYGALLTSPGREVYNNPLRLCRKGIPFFKKASVIRHEGACQYQVKRILYYHCESGCKAAIREEIGRVNGANVLRDMDRSIYLVSWVGRLLRHVFKKMLGLQ